MKKGFTLVELLAVIVILAVILVIAVPQINNVIKQTKMNSLGSTAKLIAAKAEEATVENEILENNETLTCASLVKLDDNYGSCIVSVTNGVATVTINGTGKFAGYKCRGTKSNMNCTELDGTEYVYSYGETPYYEYTYVVTDETACKTYLSNNGYCWKNSGSNTSTTCTSNADETTSASICSGNGYNGISTSNIFKTSYYQRKGYTYTITNSEACETYLENNMMNIMLNEWHYTEEQAQTEIEAVCSNSDNVRNETDPIYIMSTSVWLEDYWYSSGLVYPSNVSAFATVTNDMDSFIRIDSTLINPPVADYTMLKLPESNIQPNVFIRWPEDTSFDASDAEVCILYKGNTSNDVNCFKYTTYEETLQSIANVFGRENCSGEGVENLTLLDKILGIDNAYAVIVTSATCADHTELIGCEILSNENIYCAQYEIKNDYIQENYHCSIALNNNSVDCSGGR